MDFQWDKILSAAITSPLSVPSTSLFGAVLMLFFYLRKQEKGLRSELVLSLNRLQKDKEGLIARISAMQAELDSRETQIDTLRKMRREVEDKLYDAERHVEMYLEQVRELKRGDAA